MSDKHPCAGRCIDREMWTNSYPCPRNGTLEHDGKWWCKQHHPPSVSARSEERRAERSKKWSVQLKQNQDRRTAQAELERRGRAYRALIDYCGKDGMTAHSYIKRLLEEVK